MIRKYTLHLIRRVDYPKYINKGNLIALVGLAKAGMTIADFEKWRKTTPFTRGVTKTSGPGDEYGSKPLIFTESQLSKLDKLIFDSRDKLRRVKLYQRIMKDVVGHITGLSSDRLNYFCNLGSDDTGPIYLKTTTAEEGVLLANRPFTIGDFHLWRDTAYFDKRYVDKDGVNRRKHPYTVDADTGALQVTLTEHEKEEISIALSRQGENLKASMPIYHVLESAVLRTILDSTSLPKVVVNDRPIKFGTDIFEECYVAEQPAVIDGHTDITGKCSVSPLLIMSVVIGLCVIGYLLYKTII